ncbi:hypothetical protein [Solitalea canadensis]|uniref:Uncharacterized protein n=1 Tax=Solitalea canadensis (strain ATCC 29591 / DSM 3403 / JCM 21819 / LMG 8368 / NBRC 15130 / NCIMB 12057 / USAM 9D) TaxID=929556 RepID=H8KNZ7_SOLCM|nr:hypothetical protein [Solitalea canadensis]AFD05519.1 hypothetical protein Solca_0379 [Solitalea canadensis DSM 3403]
MRILLILFLGIALIIGACEREEEVMQFQDLEVGAIITKKATLKWYGSPSVDKAGLWAEIDTRTFMVVNYAQVDNHFYQDSVTVLLTYRRIGKVIYSNMGYKAEVDGIEVLEID